MTQTDPTPSAWTDGGRGTVIHWGVAQTSLGPMLVAASAKGVVRLSFGENPAVLAERFPNAELVQGGASFAALLAEIIKAAEAPGETDFDHIPVDVSGTPFQQSVWQALRRIPKGETRTYAQLAAEVGRPGAVRAAGSANGANHVSLLIPCHRVIRSDGSLGGYAWGLEIKAKLLQREGALLLL
ncbi:MAG: methylated-DNA--[protein]-cysteine S-methyltransferase [Sphingomonadales bacterium]|nr:methylated-DNA--[protein]-cysteine S-methyltransferase [Sphingomonadales bacterium]